MSEAKNTVACPDCDGTGLKRGREQTVGATRFRNFEVKTGAANECETCCGKRPPVGPLHLGAGSSHT